MLLPDRRLEKPKPVGLGRCQCQGAVLAMSSSVPVVYKSSVSLDTFPPIFMNIAHVTVGE